jgi:S-adenosylmethionine synthetase
VKQTKGVEMNRIEIEPCTGPAVAEMAVEIVERKGLGHPDSICDAVMERISQALSRAYLEHCGAILHHNCDKGLLVAGQVERRFGGGSVLDPMRLVIGDRATPLPGKDRPTVAEIAVETAQAWFREYLPRIDPERHLRFQVELRPGSEELSSLFRERRGVFGANDTSAAVGYAPLTETESLVLDTERYLNSPSFKQRHPDTGEDVKVMGVRTTDKLSLTVAMPLVDRFIASESDYFERKEEVQVRLRHHLEERLNAIQHLTISLNALDRPGEGMSGIYLSVLGTSAEDADSGEVGRGNQVNGLIALNRPRGSEAAAGKNPVSHVGKIYSVLSHLLASLLYRQIPGLAEAVVWLCSRIGAPIDQPQVVSVQVRLRPGASMADVHGPIGKLIAAELGRIPELCMELAQGRHSVC